MTFSFRSNGITQENSLAQTLIQSREPLGIITPLRPGNQDIFQVSYSLAEQVGDNLKNLILTNWGERLQNYFFGANLKPLLSELVSKDNFEAAAAERISIAVQRFMPYIILQNLSSNFDLKDNRNLAVCKLTILYDVPSIKTFNKTIQVILYAL